MVLTLKTNLQNKNDQRSGRWPRDLRKLGWFSFALHKATKVTRISTCRCPLKCMSTSIPEFQPTRNGLHCMALCQSVYHLRCIYLTRTVTEIHEFSTLSNKQVGSLQRQVAFFFFRTSSDQIFFFSKNWLKKYFFWLPLINFIFFFGNPVIKFLFFRDAPSKIFFSNSDHASSYIWGPLPWKWA